jgi:hypothetical protein
MLKKERQLISHILMVIFVFYYANICFFYHSHIINGVTIVHSHIHSKAHTQAGTHSQSELTLISALSIFQTLQATLFFVSLGIFSVLQAAIRFSILEKATSKLATCISLRAPPYLF